MTPPAPCRRRIKQLAAAARKGAAENGGGDGDAAADAAAVAHLRDADTSPPSGWRRQFRCGRHRRRGISLRSQLFSRTAAKNLRHTNLCM